MITNTQWKPLLHSDNVLAQDVAQLAPPTHGGIKPKMLENVTSQPLILEKPKPTMTNMMEKTKTTKTYTRLDFNVEIALMRIWIFKSYQYFNIFWWDVLLKRERKYLLLSLLRYGKIILSIKHFSRWRDTWHFWQRITNNDINTNIQ